MKTIGLLGGMSWQSSVSYYQAINQEIHQRLGGLHSAKLILNSVEFAPIAQLQREGDWPAMAELLSLEAQKLERAGAESLVICTNTMHKVADAVQQAIDIPLLHIADATGQKLRDDNIETVGLLGTAFTMEQEFYKGRLSDKFNLSVRVPNEQGRGCVHDIIYQELCQGIVRDESRAQYRQIIDELVKDGAQGIILGCTEIGLLVKQTHVDIPLYDTVQVHAKAAVDWALGEI